MKHFFLSLATTTTLLLLILLSTTANGDNDNIVYDVYGRPLIAGHKYYISAYKYEPVGGGFTRKIYNDFSEECRYYVIQYEDNLNYGEPTAFYPLDITQSEITLFSKINIAFKTLLSGNPSHCHPTANVWKVNHNQVELGGQIGRRNPRNEFTIEYFDKEEDAYSIRFCPRYGHVYECGYLGVVTRNGERRLVVNGTSALAVKFEPADFNLKKYGSYAS